MISESKSKITSLTKNKQTPDLLGSVIGKLEFKTWRNASQFKGIACQHTINGDVVI